MLSLLSKSIGSTTTTTAADIQMRCVYIGADAKIWVKSHSVSLSTWRMYSKPSRSAAAVTK